MKNKTQDITNIKLCNEKMKVLLNTEYKTKVQFVCDLSYVTGYITGIYESQNKEIPKTLFTQLRIIEENKLQKFNKKSP